MDCNWLQEMHQTDDAWLCLESERICPWIIRAHLSQESRTKILFGNFSIVHCWGRRKVGTFFMLHDIKWMHVCSMKGYFNLLIETSGIEELICPGFDSRVEGGFGNIISNWFEGWCQSPTHYCWKAQKHQKKFHQTIRGLSTIWEVNTCPECIWGKRPFGRSTARQKSASTKGRHVFSSLWLKKYGSPEYLRL